MCVSMQDCCHDVIFFRLTQQCVFFITHDVHTSYLSSYMGSIAQPNAVVLPLGLGLSLVSVFSFCLLLNRKLRVSEKCTSRNNMLNI